METVIDGVWSLMSGSKNTWTLEDLEAIVRKAVREAVEQVRSEEVKLVVDALNKLATYTFEGFKKILEILEKQGKVLEEHSRILEEHSKILQEHSKMLVEHGKSLAKLEATLEDHGKMLVEHGKSLAKLEATLEDHGKMLVEHGKSLAKLEVTIGSLTSRMGINMERMVLNIYKDILEQEGLRIEKVEKLRLKDVEGKYYRKGAKLEIDIYAHNDKVYFIEVKSLVDIDDVEWFNTKCNIFEEILGRRADKRIIVCINILKDAYDRSRELGIHTICGKVIEVEEEEEEGLNTPITMK
jgi:Protein of unknown function (DUF1626).